MRNWLAVLMRSFLSLALCCLLVSPVAFAADDEKKTDDEKSTNKADEKQPAVKDEDYYKLMQVFVDAFEQIERNYVKEVDRRELLEAAIRGMFSELDPYSNFISPEELSRFEQQVEQEFGGVGIQVQVDLKTKRLMVISPLPGTPAYKAGVRAGDLIMEIEGASTEGINLTDAVKTLKGAPGSAVSISIRHEGSEAVEQVKLVRDVIHVSTVMGDVYGANDKWKFLLDDEQKIAYIRLTHFGRHSVEELSETLKQLQAEGMKGLVLDMRFNPGGLLSQATEIADLFVEEGVIVSTEGRNSPKREWRAKKEGTFPDFPIAVIVNRYSASASEIVAACLQDHQRAVVVGERTWGKGSVQNVIEVEDGRSALKLTTAGYLRPSGKNLHRFEGATDWGVSPSEGYAVETPVEELQQYLEYRRQRDILSATGPPASEFKDRQLAKALEYLHGKLAAPAAAAKPESKVDAKS